MQDNSKDQNVKSTGKVIQKRKTEQFFIVETSMEHLKAWVQTYASLAIP